METKQMLSKKNNDPLTHTVGLSAVWQKCMSASYGPDCRSLDGPEHGQLGRLRKSLGMKLATEVVGYAISNWDKFARKVATNVESDIVPPKPNVRYLCQYHAMAVLMVQEELQSQKQAGEQQANEKAQATQAEEEAKGVVQIAAKAVPEVEQKPATLEEFEAIEAEVEAEWAAKEKLSA